MNKVITYPAWAAELLRQGQDVPFLRAPDIITRAILLCKYDGVLEHVLQDIKFAGRVDYLYMLQEELQQVLPLNLAGWLQQFDMVSTIPTSEDRLRDRGYDIPKELFAPLWQAARAFEPRLLVRRRQTAKLFELTPEERRLELENCFMLGLPKTAVEGRRILLCDDIFTSGATFTEAAKVLLENGAAAVTVLAFAAAHENW